MNVKQLEFLMLLTNTKSWKNIILTFGKPKVAVLYFSFGYQSLFMAIPLSTKMSTYFRYKSWKLYSVLRVYFSEHEEKWSLTNNHTHDASSVGFLGPSKCIAILSISIHLYAPDGYIINTHTKVFPIRRRICNSWSCWWRCRCCSCWSRGCTVVVGCIIGIGTIGTWVWCEWVQRCAGYSFGVFYHTESQQDAAQKTRWDSHYHSTLNTIRKEIIFIFGVSHGFYRFSHLGIY